MDGILIGKQYTVKWTKTGCSHCKCEWNTINKTSKYAHFGSKEIAKRCKVGWCSEEYSRFPSDEKSIIISHFEDLKAKAEAKECRARRKRELFDFEIGSTCGTSDFGSDLISEVEQKKSKQSTLNDYVDPKATIILI